MTIYVVHLVLGRDNALEARRNLFTADIKEKVEAKWNIKVNAQNVSLNGGAKAVCGLKVHKPFNERAAWFHWRVAKHKAKQVAKHIGTNTQL
nr:hypothetical protein Csa_5G161320 [Ipomoea batatas]